MNLRKALIFLLKDEHDKMDEFKEEKL